MFASNRILIFCLSLLCTPLLAVEPSQRAVTLDEFSSVLLSTAEASITYKGSPQSKKSDEEYRSYVTKACILEFATDLTLNVYSGGAKSLPLSAIKTKLSRVDKESMERRLRTRCEYVSVTGKVAEIINAVTATLASPSKTRAAVEKISKELNDSTKKRQAQQKVEIDMVGIVPGTSKKSDVERISHSRQNFCSPFCMEVGGYDLKCEAEYDEHETVSMITCWFGDRWGNGDNIEIFGVLKAGFSTKLGKPMSERKFQTRNAIGAVYDGEDLRWTDEAGNVLQMQSRVHRIDQGAVAIISAARREADRQEELSKQRDRKF